MTIEERFLEKAIGEKNYICFFYKGQPFKKVKPFEMKDSVLKCDVGKFDISFLTKLVVLKQRF